MCALDSIYPPTGFHFQVKIDNETYSFKEASGLSVKTTIDDISEGGENRFKYRVPAEAKYDNLELKRGILPKDSKLLNWVNETINNSLLNKIETKTIEVSLLNADGNEMKSWSFIKAWPVAWEKASFDAMKNEILIESISLSYNYFTIKDSQ